MILWDFAIKEYRNDIKAMDSTKQYKFAACCVCESILHLIGKEQNPIVEAVKDDLQHLVTMASLIADNMSIASEIKIEENLVDHLNDFIETIDSSSIQIPGLYDISMALLTFIESIQNHSIKDNVTEIASYAYQSILDEQLMFNLPEGGILESELVHLEENNLVCNQIIRSQIDWYRKIKNNEFISPVFESLR
jgi:hypothetical protein